MTGTSPQKIVSTFEAKTHLSSLLVEVELGASILITKRGKPVAKIIPFESEESVIDFSAFVLSLRKLRSRVIPKVDIPALKETGRKR